MTITTGLAVQPILNSMKNPVYKIIELAGTSDSSVEEAVENAIKRAHKTVDKLAWFEVLETRGSIENGKINHWQVWLPVGFTVED